MAVVSPMPRSGLEKTYEDIPIKLCQFIIISENRTQYLDPIPGGSETCIGQNFENGLY